MIRCTAPGAAVKANWPNTDQPQGKTARLLVRAESLRLPVISFVGRTTVATRGIGRSTQTREARIRSMRTRWIRRAAHGYRSTPLPAKRASGLSRKTICGGSSAGIATELLEGCGHRRKRGHEDVLGHHRRPGVDLHRARHLGDHRELCANFAAAGRPATRRDTAAEQLSPHADLVIFPRGTTKR